jgi:hypothetical protein
MVPSDTYGAEHLLRLFVKLPHLLAQTAMSQQEISQVLPVLPLGQMTLIPTIRAAALCRCSRSLANS